MRMSSSDPEMPNGAPDDQLPDWEALAAMDFAAERADTVRLLPQEVYDSGFGGQIVVERAVPANNEERADQPPIFFGGGHARKPDDSAYVIELARSGREAFAWTLTGDRFKDTAFGTAEHWQPGDDLEVRPPPRDFHGLP